MNRIWNYMSYLGLKEYSKSLVNRSIITANRINFIMICMLISVNVLTIIKRETNGGVFTIHTKVLLILLLICLLNVFFTYQKWHNLTKASLIIAPTLIITLLPIFYGFADESDFINAPIMILCFSFIPQLILVPKLTGKLYLASFFYFLFLVFFLDDIIVQFSPHEFNIVTTTDGFHFYYKLVLTFGYIFIQSTMYYLRSINYSFENELININNKLSESITELKATQEYLIRSEKMASLGTLAAGVAHEINNPLNFIHGGALYIETFIKDNFPERIEEVLPVIEGIHTGVVRATAIVKSLNQYSRSDALPFSNCNLHDIIDDCLLMLHNQYENRIEVQKQYTNKQYIFKGNEGKLHQAFLNILSNAIQSIEDIGKIKIITNIEKEEIYVEITDNGHGISQEYLKKIFDPFFTTKEPGKGTGLGLSITYSIIKEHNGTIEFESKQAEGTKVIVKLPIKN